LRDRKLATIEPASAYKDLAPLVERRIRIDVIREHGSVALSGGLGVGRSGAGAYPKS
jgi:hypothetical protein